MFENDATDRLFCPRIFFEAAHSAERWVENPETDINVVKFFFIIFFMWTEIMLQVREIVAVLDIDVLFYPCPKNGPNFRPKAIRLGGKKQFPYMVRKDHIFFQNSLARLFTALI